jgi:hypothetical protein
VGRRRAPGLTPEQKLNIAKAAALAVQSIETPIRLTASRTQVPGRASMDLYRVELHSSVNPAEEGHLELAPLYGTMQINLWFPRDSEGW